MFGIKTKLKNHFDDYQNLVKSPNRSPYFIENLILIFKFRHELEKETAKYDLQLPLAKRVNKHAVLAMKLLADFMPNNLGNWSINKPNTLGKKLEKQIVEIMKNYYQSPAKIAGYFTSGSTEGNIYAAWIGRNYLIKKLRLQSTEKIAFLFNSLSHYSISKAADLINVKGEELAVDKENWNTDLVFLNKTLEKLYKKGTRAFLIPLTIGYTITGTEDDIKKTCQIVEKFKKDHQGTEFFLWLDAAFSGVSKIFTGDNFKPFANKSIQLITTDFHKLLAVPYSAGLVLYREGLTNYIKRDIPYIGLVDTTLLGSRSGVSVIVTWFTMINLNKKKLKNIFLKAIAKKEKFLEEINREKLNLEIINNSNSIQACLVCKDKKSLKLLARKYQLRELNYKLLFSSGYKTINMVKLYFFPKF